MAPPSVNTHTHTHWTLPTTMSVLETPFDIHVSSVYQTHTCMQAPVSTLCISAKKTHNKGSRTRPIMSTLMPRSGIPVICSRATLSCDSSYFDYEISFVYVYFCHLYNFEWLYKSCFLKTYNTCCVTFSCQFRLENSKQIHKIFFSYCPLKVLLLQFCYKCDYLRKCLR